MKRMMAVFGVLVGALSVLAPPAGADPVSAGSASAFATSVSAGGSEVVPPTPLVEAALGEEATDTVVDVPAEPVAVNGTLNASATVHGASDIESALTVVTQEVEGPYNAQGVALIEGLDVLLDSVEPGVSLVSAAAVRSEAVAVCRGGAVSYSANSEIIDLDVGGEDIPLNAPVTDLIDAISGVLDDTGLSAVVDVDRNVVTELDGGGIAVDALVITVVTDAGPLALVTIGHAEVTGAACGTPPECSDTVDNADAEDTVADAEDPGCHTDGDAGNPATYDPNDPSEANGAAPECSDTVDNADPEDTVADAADPGCHTDGNAGNPASYDPNDPSEVDGPGALGGALPRTGGPLDATFLTASAIGAAGIGLHLLRRKLSLG